MNDVEQVAVDTSTTEDVSTETVEETTDTSETTEESVEEIKARLAKAEELAKNYKTRAEKAEGKKEKAKDLPSDLSRKDLYALMNAKVPDDDIDEVADYARLKKVSIAEALRTSFVQTLLSDKSQKRKAAEAANTKTTRTTGGKVSDSALLENAKKGILPESEDEIGRLWRLRRGLK